MRESQKIFLEEDKFIHSSPLPQKFKNELGELVISVRKKHKRENPDFSEMIKILKKTLGSQLCNRLDKIRDTRNTLHLLKARQKLKEKDVESANKTLLALVTKIQKVS